LREESGRRGTSSVWSADQRAGLSLRIVFVATCLHNNKKKPVGAFLTSTDDTNDFRGHSKKRVHARTNQRDNNKDPQTNNTNAKQPVRRRRRHIHAWNPHICTLNALVVQKTRDVPAKEKPRTSCFPPRIFVYMPGDQAHCKRQRCVCACVTEAKIDSIGTILCRCPSLAQLLPMKNLNVRSCIFLGLLYMGSKRPFDCRFSPTNHKKMVGGGGEGK